MFLLDVNCLIARCDQEHEYHHVMRDWWRLHASRGWSTCPLTENALLRILGHPSYPGGPGSPEAVRPLLHQLRQTPGHTFIADSLSLADELLVPNLEGVGAKALTDLYLLALAVHYKFLLVTFDHRILANRVLGGESAIVVLG